MRPKPCPRLLAMLALGLLLAACGQKGVLYIPQTPPAAERARLPQALGVPAQPRAAPASAPGAALPSPADAPQRKPSR